MSTQSPAYFKKWRIERARGHKRLIPAGPIQEHVRALVTKGLSIRAIAEIADVDPGCISLLNRGLKEQITAVKAKKILAARAESVFDRPLQEGFVPNIGGRRRIQALLAIGWRHQDISDWIGSNSATALHQVGDWFSQQKHEVICRAYEAHWNQPGPSAKTARTAKKLGYVPPMAWDEDAIDDPHARPAETEPVKTTVHSARAEDLELMLDSGAGYAEIMARLGVHRETLEKSLNRAGRDDLAVRLRALNHHREHRSTAA